MSICKNQQCTGCFACMNICPKDAITSTTDKLGKTIPKINSEKCIQCGLCEQVCPVLNPGQKVKPMKVYAAWSKDQHDLLLSSSGGIATVLGRRVVNDGGVIVGAASEDGMVKHELARTEDELEKFRGSKYVQSEVGGIFRSVKQYLKDGKQVMFSGTPCQIAGLKNYLQKEYSNLLTVDLICHGTPPMQYLKEHIDYVKKRRSWNSVSFRGKYDYILTVNDRNGIVYQCDQEKDKYFRAFMEALSYRDNCYSCRYACPERVSDLTVADFWGIDRLKMKHKYDGRISLVLVNSNKGKELFETIKEDIVWEEHSLEEAMSSAQTNIHHASIPHKDRRLFEEYYVKYDFERAVNKTEIGRRIKKKRIKKMLGITLLKKCIRSFRDKNKSKKERYKTTTE